MTRRSKTIASNALGVSVASVAVTLVATIVDLGITEQASTAQRAALGITIGSIAIGVGAGLVAALASTSGTRTRALGWSAVNAVAGLVCFAFELVRAV